MSEARRTSKSGSSALTRDRIVDAAIALLDTKGPGGLTFRSLATELQTGHGAIQWHVQNKDEIVAAASDSILTRALEPPNSGPTPRASIHGIALGVFTAIDAHPWLGQQLFAAPWQSATVQLWEKLGRSLEELGLADSFLFTAVSTLVDYIVGVGRQNAFNTHTLAAGQEREDFLDSVADRWQSLDPVDYPFVNRMADQLRAHDDRTEFLNGIDIILDGLEATH
ncbi:TetR/AcrR family transcriptional regulator [Leifsonia aquatica]|uniref:TetR/AcrR family transcriptional regulator n=1 Tax=Leifsonia aquatica TaxID=144185 RepID=UPI003820FDCB